jgi:hypothetical protein
LKEQAAIALLGVNSSPSSSIGSFCAGNSKTFTSLMAEILSGLVIFFFSLALSLSADPHLSLLLSAPLVFFISLLLAGVRKPQSLWRLKVLVNDIPQPYLVLNEVLFTAKSPACTSRLVLFPFLFFCLLSLIAVVVPPLLFSCCLVLISFLPFCFPRLVIAFWVGSGMC